MDGGDHVESQISGAAEQRRGEERADVCEMATLLCSVLSRVTRATLATGPHGGLSEKSGHHCVPSGQWRKQNRDSLFGNH